MHILEKAFTAFPPMVETVLTLNVFDAFMEQLKTN
jgi:hypothetical protein